jgi:hypothetical protein
MEQPPNVFGMSCNREAVVYSIPLLATHRSHAEYGSTSRATATTVRYLDFIR